MQANPMLNTVLQQLHGSMALNIAFIGLSNGLLDCLNQNGSLSSQDLATRTKKDPQYVRRWCEAAYAFEYLEQVDSHKFALTDNGRAFLPGVPGTLMPFAVSAVLSAHMAERAAGLMGTGERPGEKVLAERESILPWFGPMLEHMFGPFLEREIIPNLPVYKEVDAKGGLAVDLGCGNGWYIRRLAKRLPHLRGIGLDGFDENIRQASAAAERDGVADRVTFASGDIHHFAIEEKADLIAMNRALHHVWDQKDNVFRILSGHLKPGGVVIIWEPNWPTDIALLREPGRRAMAFQNLGEHIQGNHFLNPEEIAAEFHRVGMNAETHLFGDGREAVVVGRKPA